MSVYILCLSERYFLVNVCQHNCLFLNFHSFCYLYVYRIAALSQKVLTIQIFLPGICFTIIILQYKNIKLSIIPFIPIHFQLYKCVFFNPILFIFHLQVDF